MSSGTRRRAPWSPNPAFPDTRKNGSSISHERGRPRLGRGERLGYDVGRVARLPTIPVNPLELILLTNLPKAVGITDGEGTFVFTNPRFDDLFGYGPGELLGQPGYVLNAPSDEDPALLTRRIGDAIEARGVWQGEVHARRKDGTLMWTRASLSLVNHPEMGPLWLGIQVDISQEKSLREQLARAQKMESLGVMAGGIAHEFNNQLAVIQAHLDLMMDDSDGRESATLEDDLGQMLTATRTASELVGDILLFARKDKPRRQRLDPQPVLQRACKLAAATLSTVRIELDGLEDDDCAIHANPTEFQQICINLLNNAVQALPPTGGTIQVVGETMGPDELPKDIVRTELHKAPFVFRMRFKDSGSGIAPGHLPHIFDPFFTTKEAGQGTGLGLSIVATIVENHDGEIKVRSQQPGGTEFAVYLPGFDGSTPSRERPLALPTAPKNARILVVEDQVSLATVVARFLRRAGYRVNVCGDARDALDLIISAPKGFDLVYTDYEMPGLTGRDLVAELSRRSQDLPVIVTSGRPTPSVKEELAHMGVAAFLPKPVRLPELQRHIQECLSALPRGDG